MKIAKLYGGPFDGDELIVQDHTFGHIFKPLRPEVNCSLKPLPMATPDSVRTPVAVYTYDFPENDAGTVCRYCFQRIEK